ncbi:hypothetical protein C0991_004835 [Blastosporella zonata]|nr:hypothetical protein C0991_004835 [Blastosporella zonata]
MLGFTSELDKIHLSLVVLSITGLYALFYRCPGRKLDHIPAVGYKSHLLSFIGGFQFFYKARHLLQRGCDEFGAGVFKIPHLNRWTVVVNGEKYIEEYRKAPENVLSFHDAVEEIALTLGPTVGTNPYHIPIIRTQLTRNIPAVLPGLHEELVVAYETTIPPKDGQNEEFLKTNVDFTVTVIIAGAILNLLPRFLRPKYLQPLVEERRQKMADSGQDYPGKPNDMLSWLMDAASEEEGTLHNLARRILTVNMAAIHTSSMTFSQALFDLATHPEYVKELRDEVKSVTDREGWTSDALNQMIKVDSFIKESQRLHLLGHLLMQRVVRQPFTFSDGTVIPAGSTVGVAGYSAHMNETSYEDPHTFQPFRFVNKREETGRKVDMVSTSTDFLSFGHGLHSCPGRFFAAAELKLMLAHVLMTYDLKMEGDAGRPEDVWYMATCIPNPKAEILFRKRVA